MQGSVRKRGTTWSYRIDFGKLDGKRKIPMLPTQNTQAGSMATLTAHSKAITLSPVQRS